MRAILFDSETTGIDEPVIVQTSYAYIDHMGQPTGGWESCDTKFWNPGKPIAFGALATHHIFPEDVADMPPAVDFRLPADVGYLVGHKIDFDWGAIGEPNVKRICTLALARRMWPDADSHSLGALVYMLKGRSVRNQVKGAHDAEADIILCSYVLEAICKARQPSSLDDLWLMSEQARIPTVMTFGKHKGEPVKSIPPDYKRWLLRQPDIDPYLQKALTA